MTAPVESARAFLCRINLVTLRGATVAEIELEARDAAIRKAAFEECEKMALQHVGAAAKRRREKFPNTLRTASPEAQMEIAAEERGEDIAASIIACNIALKSMQKRLTRS